MTAEYRFRGAMSEEYRFIRLTIPGFEELQVFVREVIARYQPGTEGQGIEILEIGCGDGVTSAMILASRKDCSLTALDSEPHMIAQAATALRRYIQDNRCRLLLRDALAYLRDLPAQSVDLVASALCLHNMQRGYRHAVHTEIFRSLRAVC
jgi:ubiquinone/menaquinone biosynthesis C-methylase UbiE